MTQSRYLELVEGCKNGDRQCQEQLYKKLSSKMYGVCLRYARDGFEAEDILQNGFIKVFSKINYFNGVGSFEGWVRKIMVNTAIEHYRRNKYISCSIDISENVNAYSSAVYQEGLEAKDILRLITSLPASYRLVFNMFAIEGYSHQEIAKELGISEILSRTQLSRARGILKEKISSLESRSSKYLSLVTA
ncbi:RNA polymerase sigma factor [Paradesertivirga mongoliensis]|uniref:RNA polymerase sigma factor n=1 Tax=Paradesertivirga mongoliensis TaxID=2100740 RepID=A0ABW4ZJ37_9SPHI|nr:sigma-70 family RNA polymerase sigma factor [Pedobacter mongoliensis]